MTKERLLPQNIEAEQSVIGAILQDEESRIISRSILRPEMFYREDHRMIYEAALNVEVCDPVTVAAELERCGHTAQTGNGTYLSKCLDATYTTIHTEHYAKIVERTYQLRRLLSLPHAITEAVYSDAPDVDDVFSKIRAAVDAVRPDHNDDAVLTWGDSIDTALVKQSEREADADKTDEEARRLRLPWIDLDRLVGRLREGTVTIFAAESGVGKTSLAECCAEYWARSGFHVAFVHLEISHQRMVDRRMARWSGVPMQVIDRGKFTPEQRQAFYDALNRMGHAPGNIDYVYAAGWKMSRIVSLLEKMHNTKPLDVVIVDYLTIIPYEQNSFSMNTAQATAEQVRILKTFSDQTAIPSILLSQLNRNASKGGIRANRLRNSGETLERASVVVTLDMPMIGDTAQRGNVANVSVEKNTDGMTGSCKLYFNDKRMLWQDAVK